VTWHQEQLAFLQPNHRSELGDCVTSLYCSGSYPHIFMLSHEASGRAETFWKSTVKAQWHPTHVCTVKDWRQWSVYRFSSGFERIFSIIFHEGHIYNALKRPFKALYVQHNISTDVCLLCFEISSMIINFL